MHGPTILCRTLSIPTSGSGGKPFQFGNQWQYHSRSDRHSKVACWGLTLDLMSVCSLLRTHVAEGKVALGINHELRDFRNNKRKNLDMVICTTGGSAHAGGSKGGSRGASDFAGLVKAYGIVLSEVEAAELSRLPRLPIAGVSNVLVATEAKAAMTAFLKARPRLKDELTSSYQTIHGDTPEAIAAGLVLVNAASTFLSTDLNKRDLRNEPAVVSQHRQPGDAEKVVTGLRDLQRRTQISDSGFDAIGVVVVDCKNDGSAITRVSSCPPSPLPNDDFDYTRFINRIAQLYATRFKEI